MRSHIIMKIKETMTNIFILDKQLVFSCLCWSHLSLTHVSSYVIDALVWQFAVRVSHVSSLPAQYVQWCQWEIPFSMRGLQCSRWWASYMTRSAFFCRLKICWECISTADLHKCEVKRAWYANVSLLVIFLILLRAYNVHDSCFASFPK